MSNQDFHCHYCGCTLKTKSEYDVHCGGKKHRAKEQVARDEESATRTLFVRNFGGVRDPQQLLQRYFSQFGRVKNVTLFGQTGNKSARVEFQDTADVSRALKVRRHFTGNVSLYVKRFQYRPPRWEQMRLLHQQNVEEEMEKKAQTHNTLMQVLASAEDLTEQITLLAQRLKLSPEDETERNGICEDLTRIFSPYFEYCKVKAFGSSVNGFGTKGCDLDLFIDLQKPPGASDNEVQKRANVHLPYHKDISSVKVEYGPLTDEQLQEVEPYDRVKLLARIMSSTSTKYSETITIPSQRCPVIKFTHKPSGIKCDLSLNNRKALQNSYLLRLYGSDPRVHKLVSLVRQWGKSHDLSGGVGACHVLTSYAMTLIVLFYLMKTEPPVTPRVCDLLECVQGVEREMVEDWECLKVPADATLPASDNKATDVELLKGFFQFCANDLDWDTQAFLTKDATVKLKTEISEDPDFKDCKTNFMTVLDPFVLTHNIAANVNEKVKVKFVAEVKRAVQLTADWPEGGLGSKTQPWGIAALLSPESALGSNQGEHQQTNVQSEESDSPGCHKVMTKV